MIALVLLSLVLARVPSEEEDLLKVPFVGLNQQTAAVLYAQMDPKLLDPQATRLKKGGSGPSTILPSKTSWAYPAVSGHYWPKLIKGLPTVVETKSTEISIEVQKLQARGVNARLGLVEKLANTEGRWSSVALVERALYDTSGQVREAAVTALANRPSPQYREALEEGLAYPWPSVRKHAIAAIKVLDGYEPEVLPPVGAYKDGNAWKIRELVAIQHLANCLLCHSPSMSDTDKHRGLVPIPGFELSPEYYKSQEGHFVKADTILLRQDFSIMQEVANPGKWPILQRFDYLLRTRAATSKEIAAVESTLVTLKGQ